MTGPIESAANDEIPDRRRGLGPNSRAAPGSWRVPTPAKINLTLRVLGSRPDGYHEIDSILTGVELWDELLAVPMNPRTRPMLQCDHPGLNGPDNLVLRAHSWFITRYGAEAALSFTLKKRIPVAAGLGGGSSNAAGALMLCRALLASDRSTDDLERSCVELGSDIPFFFHLPAARIRGKGERVDNFKLAWFGWVLLAHFPVEVSTRRVYDAWDALGRGGEGPDADPLAAAMTARSATELSSLLINDLEAAIFAVAPAMREAVERVRSMGFARARISGAGSTLFLLFDDAEESAAAAARLSGALPTATIWVIRPVGRPTAIEREMG